MPLSLNTKYLEDFISKGEYGLISNEIKRVHKLLHHKTGVGSEFTGWLNLPSCYNKEEFIQIKETANKIKNMCDILVVIGIGGSYLGARAVIEAINSQNYNNMPKDTPDIYFIGNSISTDSICDLLKICEDKDICVNIISKSGTTTEPSIAFRVFRNLLESKYGREYNKRIFCTTDRSKGTLKEISDKEGYETFVIPDDVGGRYSVLTAVGLLPIAVSGISIDKLMLGAQKAELDFSVDEIDKNDCYKYAAIRNMLYKKGKEIEILATYEPKMSMFGEWYKQLFGESEGKDKKGIFPSSVTFSTDLHSMGQFIQDGSRNLFETVIYIESNKQEITLDKLSQDIDGLNFLAGKNISYINKKAFEGTLLAHTDGGVPNIVILIPEMNEFELGYLIYFFEKACAISAYILGVNPFNQPGVESYKKNMFALLGKPGYESEFEALSKRLK